MGERCYCPACGAPHEPGDRYCGDCGQTLAPSPNQNTGPARHRAEQFWPVLLVLITAAVGVAVWLLCVHP